LKGVAVDVAEPPGEVEALYPEMECYMFLPGSGPQMVLESSLAAANLE